MDSFKDHLDEILNLEWDEQDRSVIERIIKQYNKWKRMIPSSLEKDILYLLNLAIREKKALLEYRDRDYGHDK